MFAGPLDAVAFALSEQHVEVESSMQAYCWCHGLYLASQEAVGMAGKASYLSVVVWNVAAAPLAKIREDTISDSSHLGFDFLRAFVGVSNWVVSFGTNHRLYQGLLGAPA